MELNMSEKATKTVTFKFEKETKNAIRFVEESDVPVVGTLYVQKHALAALGNSRAQTVQITIELL